ADDDHANIVARICDDQGRFIDDLFGLSPLDYHQTSRRGNAPAWQPTERRDRKLIRRESRTQVRRWPLQWSRPRAELSRARVQSPSSANGLRMALPHRASRSADDRRAWSAASGHALWMTSSWRSTISRASFWSRW